MIESENRINNFHCTFDSHEMNRLNYSKLDLEHFFEVILSTSDNIHFFNKHYDQLITTHGKNIIKFFRKLEVNYREVKVNIIIMQRETLLCGYLIKYLNCREFDKDFEHEGNLRIQNDRKYYKNLIDKAFPDNPETIFSDVFEQCKDYLTSKSDDKIDQEEISVMVDFLKEYSSKEQDLIKTATDDHKPSNRILSYYFTQLNLILESSIHLLKHIENLKDINFLKKKKEEKNLVELLQNCTKLGILGNALYYAFNKTEDDLFEKDISHPDWQIIIPHYYNYMIGTRQKIIKVQNEMLDMMIIAAASVKKSIDKNKDVSLFKKSLYMSYYFLFKERARNLYDKMSIKFNFDVGVETWNTMDSKGLKTLTKIGFPSIAKRNRFILKINYYEKTNDDLNEILCHFVNKERSKLKTSVIILDKNTKNEKTNKNTNNDKNNNIENKYEVVDHNIEEDIEKPNRSRFDSFNSTNSNEQKNEQKNQNLLEDCGSNLNLKTESELNEKSNSKCEKPMVKKEIPLKFLSSGKNNQHIPSQYFNQSCKSCCCGQSNSVNLNSSTPGDIIIHIHGGGFVAMSSDSHEIYLRKWVNKLNIPAVSIDYSLAPEYKYPVALNEVYETYNWLINDSGIKLRKIILAGDSAGGNLIVSLTHLLIVTKKRLPDYLICSYPALHSSYHAFSPSMLIALSDVLLPSSLLSCVMSAYTGNANGDKDFFLSPGLMHDEVIKYMPHIKFYLTECCPLRDQSFRFLSRLLKNGVKAEAHEFKYLSHGYLNFDAPLINKDFAHTNDLIIKHVKEYFNL